MQNTEPAGSECTNFFCQNITSVAAEVNICISLNIIQNIGGCINKYLCKCPHKSTDNFKIPKQFDVEIMSMMEKKQITSKV